MLDILEQLVAVKDPLKMANWDHPMGDDIILHTYAKDREGKYLYANDAQAKTVGLLKGSDMIGANDFDFSPVSFAQEFQLNDKKVILNKKSGLFFEKIAFIKENTSCRGLSYKKILCNDHQKVIGILGFSFVDSKDKAPHEPFLLTPTNHQHVVQTRSTIKLSTRQTECLIFLIKGFTQKQIARQIGLSPKTIENYFYTLKKKMGCYSKSQLIEKALCIPNIKSCVGL